MAVARPNKIVLNVERQNFSVSVQQAVLCPVASPVPFVLSVRGQSQKKDTSPSLKMKQEIKFVKDAFYCVNISYLVDRCICPAPCRSRQTLEKNVLSWALAGTGSVLFIRQVAV